MKSFGVTSVLLLTLLLGSLSAGEAQVLQPNDLCGDQPDAAIATFEDANLEVRLRAALSISDQDDLTCDLVAGLRGLTAPRAGIESLVGMQNLTGLTILNLYTNSITDISALSELTTLTELRLQNAAITDISALSGLTSLTSLYLDGNSISDISALSALTGLTFLNLGSNSIIDITAVSGLSNLRQLYLGSNPITDITALSGLTSLTVLGLRNDSISDINALSGLTSLALLNLQDNPALADIQPLIDNLGLGAGDGVNLTDTNVSCTDITALRAKGVTVTSPCS